MHRTLTLVVLWYLSAIGTLHIVIDVVSQYLRHKRVPGPETTLYYGLNTAYGLSQVLVGVFGLIVARHAFEVFKGWEAQALLVFTAVAWIVFAQLFIEYREPKIFGALYAVGVVAAIVVGKLG